MYTLAKHISPFFMNGHSIRSIVCILEFDRINKKYFFFQVVSTIGSLQKQYNQYPNRLRFILLFKFSELEFYCRIINGRYR